MNYEEIIGKIKPIDKDSMEKTQKKLDNLTKPPGSLGRLEELAKEIAGMKETSNPSISKKAIFTFAGDHGVTDEGVSAYPKTVTAQMVYNFVRGGAAINVLSKAIGAELIVADLGVAEDIFSDRVIIKKVGYGTNNFCKGPAMTRENAIKSINYGIEIFNQFGPYDIIGIGEMGIGNTTPSSAIASVFTDAPVEDVTGRGTGVGDEAYKNKVRIIKKSIELNKPDKNDPIDVLSKIGGYEIGGLVGVVLAAAMKRTPVVIDGFISTAAALIASKMNSNVSGYIIPSHKSVEIGHIKMLEQMKKKPLFELDMRLGEGTGAVIGISICEMSLKLLNEMATFDDAGVSKKN